MSVLLTTSLGDLVIDLNVEKCPLASKNFLKLCKIKYYNNCLFHSVQKDFIVQTGDPTGTGSGGDSIYKFLYGDQARFFTDEIHPDIKHDKVGVVAMASAGENLNASQFYITTRADLDYLDGKHTVFGIVAEGEDVLMRINEAFVDEKFRPYKNIRIKHTYVLEDPFDDPPELAVLIPENSPELRPPAEGEEVRLEDDWVPLDEQLDPEELDKSLRQKEAHSRAVVLEMIGDIPEAEIKPPENVLFVCKLNPVTQEEDLEVIFSRFGKIVSADIIRDYKTGDSLCYAFIEFETQEACEAAYFKMDNVLIDDRRIHVDFSQSVARLWTRYRRFGKNDDGDAVGGTKGKGCFKCGEDGHIAKDCPENNENGERPKYRIKNTDGQHGGSGKRYDLVFDHASIEDDGDRRQDRNDHRKREREERYPDDRSKDQKIRGHKSTREERDRGERRGRDREHNETRDREYKRDKYEDRHERRDREDRRSDDKQSRDRDRRDREQKHERDGDYKDSGRHTKRSERDDPRRSDRDGRTNERDTREDRNHYEPSSRHHYKDERRQNREVSPEKDHGARKSYGEHHSRDSRHRKESEHSRRRNNDSD